VADRIQLARQELARRELAKRRNVSSQEETTQPNASLFSSPAAIGPALFSNVLNKRQQGIASETAKGTVDVMQRSLRGVGETLTAPVRQPVQTATGIGNLAGGLIQEGISPLGLGARFLPGKEGREEATKGFKKAVKERYGSIENIAETVATDPFGFLLDISALGGLAGAGLKQAGRGAQFPLTGQFAKSTAAKIDKAVGGVKGSADVKVNKIIDTTLPKIAKVPKGKTTRTQIESARNRQRDAVKTIVENKENLTLVDEGGRPIQGNLPKNFNEFSQSIDQTKGVVFQEYNALLKETGQAGKTINITPAIKELDKVINKRAIQIKKPEIIEYAQDLKTRMLQDGDLPVNVVDDLIREFNNDLNAFYRNPNPNIVSNRMVDAGVVNKLRKSLDETVSEFTGREFQVLKNRYGSLRELETAINKEFLKDASKIGGGLTDFVNVFGGGDLVGGLLAGVPERASRGAAIIAFSKLRRILNDPNRLIKKLFKEVDKFHVPRPNIINPEILPPEGFGLGQFRTAIGQEKRLALPFEKTKALGFDPTFANRPGVIGTQFGPKGRFGDPEFTVR